MAQVKRESVVDGANRLWFTAITYVPTLCASLYLAVVLDLLSRRIVGRSKDGRSRAELVVDALNMAVAQRRPGKGVVHHSDPGSQYTSLKFGKRCGEAGIKVSMGSVEDCYDNAMAGSLFASLESELLHRTAFQNHAEARSQIFRYIEAWYNTDRRTPPSDTSRPSTSKTGISNTPKQPESQNLNRP